MTLIPTGYQEAAMETTRETLPDSPPGSIQSKGVPIMSQPQTPSDIPGLGPIRVRALHKAGYQDIRSLQDASLEDLMRVPGITEAKARQIQTYLQLHRPPPVSHEDTLPARIDASVNVADDAAPDLPQPDVSRGATLLQQAVQCMGEVIGLLLSTDATHLRTRLLRELGAFSQHAESLALDAAYLPAETQDKAIRRLKRAGKVIVEFSASASDRKAQTRLAELLEELNTKLAECKLAA